MLSIIRPITPIARNKCVEAVALFGDRSDRVARDVPIVAYIFVWVGGHYSIRITSKHKLVKTRSVDRSVPPSF